MPTRMQVAALRYLLFHSRDGSDLAKRLVAFLIEKSRGLKNEVCVTLTDGWGNLTGEQVNDLAHEVDCFNSANGSTHFGQVLAATGTRLRLDVHYGRFVEPGKFSTEGIFGEKPGAIARGHENDRAMPMSYTFWLARPFYSRRAEIIQVTREELEKIDLRKPGLYPSIEPGGRNSGVAA